MFFVSLFNWKGAKFRLRQPLWVRNMALVEMKAAAFLVREKGFNPKSFLIKVTSFLSQFHIGKQVNRRFCFFTPPRYCQNRAIFLLCHIDIGHDYAIARLQMYLVNGKLVVVIIDQAVFCRAADVFPSIVNDSSLQLVAIKFTVAQKDDFAAFGQQRLNHLHQLTMRFFWKMPFVAPNHNPHQWQRAFLIDDAYHQRQTVTSYFAAV